MPKGDWTERIVIGVNIHHKVPCIKDIRIPAGVMVIDHLHVEALRGSFPVVTRRRIRIRKA